MTSFKRVVHLFAIALLGTAVAGSDALAATATETYLDSYNAMGKKVAVWASSQTALTNAQNSVINTWAGAQTTLVNASNAMLQATANAASTNAKTLQALQALRTAALANELKVASTYYEMCKAHQGYQAQHVRKRPDKEALARFAKTSVAGRLASYRAEGGEGKIQWPRALQGEEFLEYRVQIDSLLGGADNGSYRQARQAVTQIRNQLKSQVRQMRPAEYMATRKFIDALTQEVQMPR